MECVFVAFTISVVLDYSLTSLGFAAPQRSQSLAMPLFFSFAPLRPHFDLVFTCAILFLLLASFPSFPPIFTEIPFQPNAPEFLDSYQNPVLLQSFQFSAYETGSKYFATFSVIDGGVVMNKCKPVTRKFL